MKNLFKPMLFAAALFSATHLHAQSGIKRTAKKVGQATSSAAKDVGHATSDAAKNVADKSKKVGNKTADVATTGAHKTSEVASKGASAVIDKRFDGKYGPGGEKIYIDGNAKYYYVDKKGRHVFLSKEEMHDNLPM